jgi:hypothetical protein
LGVQVWAGLHRPIDLSTTEIGAQQCRMRADDPTG